MAGFVNVGSEAAKALREHLLQAETQRRQQILDGITMIGSAQRMQQQQAAADRQARMDAIADEDRQRRIANEDRAYQDAQARQTVLDQRYAAEQQAKEMAAKDAAANRYLDTERGYYEADKKRTFEAGEATKDRASQERRTAMGVENHAAGAPKPPTEGQRKTEGLLARAQDARQTVDLLESHIGNWDLLAPTWAQTAAGQQYQQGAKQWIQSVLRDESGAAIGKDEEASYFHTYFRQPGDSTTVVAQKQRARDAAEAAMRTSAGMSSGGNSGKSRYVVSVE